MTVAFDLFTERPKRAISRHWRLADEVPVRVRTVSASWCQWTWESFRPCFASSSP